LIALATLNSQFVHSNLALRYLAGIARRMGQEVELMEFTVNEDPGGIARRILQQNPDLIAFSCYIWNIEKTLKVIQVLKKVQPSLVIMAGGPEVSYDSLPLMKTWPGIDAVIRGEGEITFGEVLRSWSDKAGWEGIAGLTWREGEEVHINPDRPLLKNLDDLPRPYQNQPNELENRIIYYETSRGCPFRCSYCLSSIDPGVRYFSLERVKEELAYLAASGIPQIKMVDRSFNCHSERALTLMEFMASLPGSTCFHLEIVPDLLDREMLSFLRGLPEGKFQFEMGIQTTNSDTLNRIDRKQDLSRTAENIAALRETGNIHLHLDLIAGLPGEDYASIARSFNWAYALQPHYLQLGFLKLLKGTAIREQARDEEYVSQDFPPYEVLTNRWLNFSHLNQLKAIEDLVQKYYNSGAFSHALKYFIARYHHGDAFGFFEALADYFIAAGWEERPLARSRLYEILADYLEKLDPPGFIPNRELLRFDFFWSNPNLNEPWKDKPKAPDVSRRIKERLRILNRDRTGDQRSQVPGQHFRIELFAADVLALAGIREKATEPAGICAVLFSWHQDKMKADYIDLWSEDHAKTPSNCNRS
jgi:anaerobic magnesium-protoporphyrin IX monomethyl ester cyclase